MLIPIILAGGAGTRLWPVSRESRPKPFLRIGEKTLLTQTYERALAVAGDATPLIVTNRDYYFLSKDDLAQQSRQPQYLLEPVGRNTGPAIALAALWALQQDASADMLVMPADHFIRDTEAFGAAVASALTATAEGFLTLFGVSPTGPETGFGYIETGTPVGSHARRATRFIEKPDAVTASRYLEAGNYVWNSGMFCFKAQAILDAFALYCPGLLACAREVWNDARAEGDKILLPAAFAAIENISIDYAVMEKAKNIAVVEGGFDWTDVGAWNAVADATPSDENGNTSNRCEPILLDSHNTHVEANDRLVVAIGVDDLVLIDTEDALLVAHKAKAQQVRDVVAELKAKGHEAHKIHRTVMRPWGSYTVLQEGPGFKIKRIEVKPRASLSLQMHHHRSEHWVVVSGTAEVTNGKEQTVLAANQSTYIPAGNRHRLRNPGNAELVLIEVQCGTYVGEDDIVRFEDVYGREQ